MIFRGITLLPNERKNVPLPIPDVSSLNALCLYGATPSKALMIMAGVYGCEYTEIRALRRLMAGLDPARLSGNVILLPLADPSASYARAKQVAPGGNVNLSRTFPDNSADLLPARLAFALGAALYPGANLLTDLHSGDCSETLRLLAFFPATEKKMVNQASLGAAKVLTVPYQVRSTTKNGLYNWAVRRDIPALLIEKDGQGLWSG